MDALKYDLKDTYIVRFNQKETEIAMTTNNLQVFYGNKQAFLTAICNSQKTGSLL